MKNILLIESSPRGADSYSHQVARSIVADIEARNGGTKVTVRDLVKNPPPHIGLGFITGSYVPAEQRTPEQAEALAVSDALIDELFKADTIVITVPMHNFSAPSTLKVWLDNVVRAGKTYSFSSNGPEGFLKGKRIILVVASGGVYSSGPMQPFDFTDSYLRAVFGFIGITDIETVRVEGTAVSEIGSEKALNAATAQYKQILSLIA